MRVRIAIALFVVAGVARAEDMEGDAVFIPMPAGESLRVENPLGAVRLRAWDRPEVRVVASKRARTSALLERLKVRVDLQGGQLDVKTGIYLTDNTWHALPLGGSSIDLTIDAPRAMTVTAKTFAGAIDAEGFRSGAHLSSQEGEIRAVDLEGPVDTHSLEGRQSLQGIHGRLLADGVDGDLDLQAIEGDRVDATVYRGQVAAREVRSQVVRLRTTIGTIIYVGELRPGGRYELATHEGDVRMSLRPVPFRIWASAKTVRSIFPITDGEVRDTLLRGTYRGGGASLELVSATGTIDLSELSR